MAVGAVGKESSWCVHDNCVTPGTPTTAASLVSTQPPYLRCQNMLNSLFVILVRFLNQRA